MNKRERRAQGAHYTTEKNILKVIEPLFLDELRAEFDRLKVRRDTNRANALRAFQAKLAGLNFLDPACGCGNFLIIAYRELRTLEMDVIKELNPDRVQQELDVASLSLVDVGQFYGIELNEFPSGIAEVALWMMDHIMNVRLSLEFGQVFARIPLKASPHIHCGDALELDWATVLAPVACAYVFGNPPFVGQSYQTPTPTHTNLFDAAQLANTHLVVADRRLPLSPDIKPMRMGSKIVDNGIYCMTSEERLSFLGDEPNAEKFVVPLVGSVEFINGLERWILDLHAATPQDIRAMPAVAARVSAVRAYRQASKKAKTRELADYPTKFEVTTIPDRPFLAVPKVSSERREYLPIGWLEPPTLPSQLVQVILYADTYDFGVLTSRMHMSWLRYVGGRLKSDYQYSIGLVYNAFVWPSPTTQSRAKVAALAQAVLDARAQFPDATLADLYDADAMPVRLRKAHSTLDAAVDRLYNSGSFISDRSRAEHLFELYEKRTAPLTAATQLTQRRTRQGVL